LEKSTPKVIKGIEPPNAVNIHSIRQLQKKRSSKPVETYVKGILDGNRVLLSQAITLIESSKAEHQEKAQAIVNACLPHTSASFRLGITGTPGVGKSTFIEQFGQYVIQQGKQLAVLAVDPTSQISHGSILGDKTRMQNLSTHEKAFIRPSPAGNSLGGVARKTRESIILCEAAGFDFIMIETVGVGQSEIAVHSMVDFFLLLLLPGGGDELQGIKRGIVEMADLIAINKADGDNITKAKQARREYNNGLHMFPPKLSNWTATAILCSGLSGMGMEQIWEQILKYQQQTFDNNYFNQNRQQQAKYWLHETVKSHLLQMFYENPNIKNQLALIEQQIQDGQLSPFHGAEQLLNIFKPTP
jgi:LAO/AO transport system kinase